MQVTPTTNYSRATRLEKPVTPVLPVGGALVTTRDAAAFRRQIPISGLVELSATLIAQHLEPPAGVTQRSIGLPEAVSAYETASDLAINRPDARSILL